MLRSIYTCILCCIPVYSVQASDPYQSQLGFRYLSPDAQVNTPAPQFISMSQQYAHELEYRKRVLIQSLIREYEYCNVHHIDPIWLSPAAHDVTRRCTAINYLNGPKYAHQQLSPSQLPPNFQEDFRDHSWSNGISSLTRERDCAYYDNLFRESTMYGQRDAEIIRSYERAFMRRWSEYRNAHYCRFIKSFASYESYMLEIAAQVEHDKEFHDILSSINKDLPHYLCKKAVDIKEHQKRKLQEVQQLELMKVQELRAVEQIRAIHEIYVHQTKTFQEYINSWASEHPERYHAYQETVSSNGTRSIEQYTLSPHGRATLTSHNISPVEYQTLEGNMLQHELMREIIAGVERTCHIIFHRELLTRELGVQNVPSIKFEVERHLFAYPYIIDALESARKVNDMGDVITAAKLIDLAHIMLDYSAVAVEGLISGAVQGGIDAVHGLVQLATHPIETINHLGLLARKVVELAHEYLPPLPPSLTQLDLHNSTDPPDDTLVKAWIQYDQECAQVSQRWATLTTQLYQSWQQTPTRDLIKKSSEAIGNFATNIFVTAKCTQLLAAAASKGIQAIAKLNQACKAGQQVLLCELVEGGESIKWCQEVSKESKLLSGAKEIVKREITINEVIALGKEVDLSAEVIGIALKNLQDPKLGGSIEIFYKTIQEFEHILGAKRLINDVLKNSIRQNNWSTAKGAYHELHCGLHLHNNGHKIIEFGKIVNKIEIYGNQLISPGVVEFDIITESHVIECKNVTWARVIESAEGIQDIVDKCREGTDYANILGKKFILYSKNPVPEFIKEQYFKNITIIEGI